MHKITNSTLVGLAYTTAGGVADVIVGDQTYPLALVSASPELLALLRRWVALDGITFYDAKAALLIETRAAIAKAEG